MKLKSLLFISSAVLLANTFSACKGDDPVVTPPPATESYILTGDVTSNRTLSADRVWTLKGYVYVKSGATLTIPAGTIIKSDIVEKGALIVERGGKLIADGTVSKPIVFTSGLAKGQRRPGDWGGIVILGKAPTNRATEPTIEGGINRQYGGTDANDNSGILRYVRIEFAGIAAAPGSEINGLTLGGVGAGTTIEYVQVSYGNDDAYEFFGGTVNAKHVIAFASLDDDFDFDFGYTGMLQYGLSVKHPQFADNGDASNGIESDNDGTGTLAMPFTHPKISNFTFVGPNNRSNTQANHNFGNRWRRSAHFTVRNSILMGHQKAGFSIESAETGTAYTNGTSEFKNNLVHAITLPYYANSGSGLTNAGIEAKAMLDGCMTLAAAADAKITDPFSLTAPSFVPAAGSPALSGANYTGLNGFFTTGSFIGAMGATDWTTGWTNFDPNNADY